MILLSIDTFDMTTGAAVCKDGVIAASYAEAGFRNRDADISRIVRKVLDGCGCDFNSLNGVVVAKGPGSFTGLRVGAAYAKALCYALKIGLTAVDSMEVLAGCAGETDMPIIPVIHAKGEEVYFAGYWRREGDLRRWLEKQRGHYLSIKEYMKEPAVFAGGGFIKHKDRLISAWGEYIIEAGDIKPEKYAEEIAKLGYIKALKGEFEDLRKFEPEYPEFK